MASKTRTKKSGKWPRIVLENRSDGVSVDVSNSSVADLPEMTAALFSVISSDIGKQLSEGQGEDAEEERTEEALLDLLSATLSWCEVSPGDLVDYMLYSLIGGEEDEEEDPEIQRKIDEFDKMRRRRKGDTSSTEKDSKKKDNSIRPALKLVEPTKKTSPRGNDF